MEKRISSEKMISCRNIPPEARYQEVCPEIGHWVHAEAWRGFQEALTVFLLVTHESSYFPCYSGQHEEYNLDQNTHNTHAVAFCPQFLLQVLLLSALQTTYQNQKNSIRLKTKQKFDAPNTDDVELHMSHLQQCVKGQSFARHHTHIMQSQNISMLSGKRL